MFSFLKESGGFFVTLTSVILQHKIKQTDIFIPVIYSTFFSGEYRFGDYVIWHGRQFFLFIQPAPPPQ